MITYAKVLELGLKHDPIENPGSYSWTQINDTAVCGPLIDGRDLDQVDFDHDIKLAMIEFIEAQRLKFGENLSFLIITSNENTEADDVQSIALSTGNHLNLAVGLLEGMDRNNEFKKAFVTAGILRLNKNKDNNG
jgi:hypothetical protein